MAKLTDQQRENLIIDALKLKDNGKKVFTQQQLADKYGISKSMVNRYVQEKVNRSKQLIPDEIEARVNLKKIENEKSELLSKHEQEEVNKYIDNTVRNILYIDRCIAENQKLTDILQQQTRHFIEDKLTALEEGTTLPQDIIYNTLTLIDGFSKVSTRNRMAIMPKDGMITPKGEDSDEKSNKNINIVVE